MIILGQKLQLLNQSFDDLAGIKVAMAQLDSQLTRQGDRLQELGRQVGDMTKTNSDSEGYVAGFAEKIDEFKVGFLGCKTVLRYYY